MEDEHELEELISQADPLINELIDAYEPYEASYTAAMASPDVTIASSSTSGLPASLTISASSAR